MPPDTGFALPGGLAVPPRVAVELLGEAADALDGPVLATEVSGVEAFGLLAAVAARRPGTRLGTGVVPLGSRSEPAMAMAATTVADVADAPFLLGVGVSTPAVVAGWHGVSHTPGRDETRARLRTLRAVLDGERRGSFRLAWPLGPRVGVLLGAMGPRMTELAFAETDGVIVNHTPPDALPVPPEDRRLLVYVWFRAAPDAEQRVRRELVSYATAPAYARHFERLGFGEDVETVARLRADGRLREAPEQLSHRLVDGLYVTEQRLAARLEAVRAVGGVPVVLPVTGDDPVRDVRHTLRVLGGSTSPVDARDRPRYRHGRTLRDRLVAALRDDDRGADDVVLHGRDYAGAAVALAVVRGRDGDAEVPMILRSTGLRTHASQYGLPGGKTEAGETVEETARRELEEELGLVTGHGDVLGRLPAVVTRSGFRIVPVVVWVDDPAAVLTPDPGEVAEVYRLPLAAIAASRVEAGGGGFPILGTAVFAPTGEILQRFRDLLLDRAEPVGDGMVSEPPFTWR
ncbi:LLM class flavin-dependent oxidoreductase [Egicoccus sp. AB-alg2]|uniref:LLM class flavin-dependent oxidoreductase n=1 Tax=Egicoccus sp. AB-alg2 TaxID=3242693 RepID=UPI00359E9A52